MNPESKKNRLLEDFLKECCSCHSNEEMESVLQKEFLISNTESIDDTVTNVVNDNI